MNKTVNVFIRDNKNNSLYSHLVSSLEDMEYLKHEVNFSKKDITLCSAFLTLAQAKEANRLYRNDELKEAYKYIEEHSNIIEAVEDYD